MIKSLLITLFLLIGSASSYAQPRDLPDFTDLAEKQGPAVVNISTTQTLKAPRSNYGLPFDEEDPAFEFFRRFMPRQNPGMPREYKTESLGSGFIISGDGYIISNAHVVDGADDIVVKLTDKREFKGKVVGADKRSDIALLKIEATGLPTAKLGDPGKLKVGEWVVAIGAPFGFENSMTAGIVSAKGRSLPQENYVPFIQTDVAINPGNSGGPLFNMKGEVVGVNSQIYSRSGGYMGLSFAIPIDVAMDVQAQLRNGGKVSRGRIGVMIQEVTRELAESFGLPKPQGALVASVEKNSPAEKAGIESGDVILKFDGKSVGQSSELPRIVASTRPGSKAAVQVWRKGAAKELMLTVAEIQDEKQAGSGRRSGKNNGESAAQANRLGWVLSEIGPEQRKQLGISGGVMVEDVRSDGRGELRPGDIILALIHKGVRTEIRSVEQFNQAVGSTDKGSNLTLLVRRGEGQNFIIIRGIGGDK